VACAAEPAAPFHFLGKRLIGMPSFFLRPRAGRYLVACIATCPSVVSVRRNACPTAAMRVSDLDRAGHVHWALSTLIASSLGCHVDVMTAAGLAHNLFFPIFSCFALVQPHLTSPHPSCPSVIKLFSYGGLGFEVSLCYVGHQ
jgi:hypothetical protein